MKPSDGGKGSAPRPIPDWDKFSDNFDAIFGKKDAGKTQDTKSYEGQEEGRDGRRSSQATGAK